MKLARRNSLVSSIFAVAVGPLTGSVLLGCAGSAAPPADPPLLADPPAPLEGSQAKGNPELDRGVAFVKNGKLAEAIPHLEAAYQAQPDSSEAAFYLATALDQGGSGGDRGKDKQRAEELYKKALELDAKLVEAAQNLAALYLEEPPRPDEAIAVLQKGLATSPGDPRLLTNLGYAHALKGDVDKASKAYDEALAKEDTAATRFAYGTMLFENKRAEAAVPHLLKAAAGLQDDAASLATIARMLGPGKAFGDCVRLLDRAITLKPDVAELLVRRGVCKHELKKERDASKDYEAAIKVDPKYQPAYYYHGLSLLEQSQRDAGRAQLKKAWEMGKETPIGKLAREKLDGKK